MALPAPTGTRTPAQTTVQNLLGSVAPQTGAAELQLAGLQGQAALVGPTVASTEQYNAALAGQQQGQLGIAAQQNQLSQLGNTQQKTESVAQQAIEQQQYAVSTGQYPEQQAEASLAYNNALKSQQDTAAASGTTNTPGQSRALSTLQQGYQFQTEDIMRAEQEATLGQQGEVAGYQYSQEQLANASSNLDLIAKANGISQQQVLTMLQYGQQQTGVQGQQDLLSILSQAGTVGEGDLSTVGAALSPLGFSGGINALAGIGG